MRARAGSSLLFAWLAATAVAIARQPSDAAVDAAVTGIDARTIRAHMSFLADDLLEGRHPGTRGYRLAAHYVATELAKLGLDPAGNEGSFYQEVPLVESRLAEGGAAIFLTRGGATEDLEHLVDFIARGDIQHTESSVEGKVVFVGFGVTAPELGYDDYGDIDVRGKFVMLLYGAPASFPSEQRAHFASTHLKMRNAAGRGAIGILMLFTPELEQRVPWERMTQLSGRTSMTWLHPDGSREGFFPELRFVALLSRSGAEKVFADSTTTIDDVFLRAREERLEPFEVPVVVRGEQKSEQERVASRNVIGLLKGSDLELATSYVVYSAHLDHDGIGAAVNGDDVYNGAYDNASGVASLLELARAFAKMETRPRRSILFVAVTAEEKGLLGSDYFASYPPVARESIVADINLDMPLWLYPMADVVAFGAENSTLGETVARACDKVGLTVSPDPMPEENIFIRSDQYSFVRKGVPAVYVIPGFASSDPKIDGAEEVNAFLTKHYHQPTDDMSGTFDWESAVKYVQVNFLIGWFVAQDEARPRWNPGNFFGETFAERGIDTQ